MHNAIPGGMLSSHAHCRAAAEKEADMQPPPRRRSVRLPSPACLGESPKSPEGRDREAALSDEDGLFGSVMARDGVILCALANEYHLRGIKIPLDPTR